MKYLRITSYLYICIYIYIYIEHSGVFKTIVIEHYSKIFQKTIIINIEIKSAGFRHENSNVFRRSQNSPGT